MKIARINNLYNFTFGRQVLTFDGFMISSEFFVGKYRRYKEWEEIKCYNL